MKLMFSGEILVNLLLLHSYASWFQIVIFVPTSCSFYFIMINMRKKESFWTSMLYFQLNLGYESSNFTGFQDLSFCELKFASSYIMQALAELPGLRKCGRRVLIFSQWTSMLDILE
ncbi:hypothetical protein NC653_021304 [Populus alba x Populus x berolinensis]|uniref:Uncharacterized protein n=1 Tax=Populus alba x Populus x berolinensis TaxID=444605 RepID=A0AAD6MPW0_9ROSI|nr:hypothetical protein NC653_021304 [Populus alba x Populus x berolinensis]